MSRDTRKTKKTTEESFSSKKFSPKTKYVSNFSDKEVKFKSSDKKPDGDFIKDGLKQKRERIRKKVGEGFQSDKPEFKKSEPKSKGYYKKSADFNERTDGEAGFPQKRAAFKSFKPKFNADSQRDEKDKFKSKSDKFQEKKSSFYKDKKEGFSDSFEKKNFSPSSKSSFFEKKSAKPDFISRKRIRKEDSYLADVEEFDAFDNETINYDDLRLNKFLAHCGIASRRKADELITQGKVTVNGAIVTAMGHRVSISDDIRYDGKKITPENKVYIILNKPKDYITTTSDEKNRKTVMDLVKPALAKIKGVKKPRLYPIGRLDRNTTGVLLITNDGELAQNLTHPSKKIRKVYHVFLDKKLSQSDFEKIAMGGVVLEDGIAEVDAIAFPNPKTKAEVGLEIHTGKNRFVRRLFEALGYEVVKLDRVSFAEFTKKDIPRGKFRFLTNEEIRNLKHFTN